MKRKKHYSLDELREILPKKTDQEFIDSLSQGVLGLTSKEANAVTFLFFLSCIAERDLHYSIRMPIALIKATLRPAEFVMFKNVASNLINRNRPNRSRIDIEKLEYFKDKILAYEDLFKKNNVSKVLWKLNDLRNDISHGRLKGLIYKRSKLELLLLDERHTWEVLFSTTWKRSIILITKIRIMNDIHLHKIRNFQCHGIRLYMAT